MKTTTIIFSLLVLISCNRENAGTISQPKLEEAQKLCETNEGIRTIHLKEQSFKVVCNNDAHSSKIEPNGKNKVEDEATESSASISGSEIKSCEVLCNNNTGVKSMASKRDCSKWIGFGRSHRCDEYSDYVSCECNNTIVRNTARVVIDINN